MDVKSLHLDLWSLDIRKTYRACFTPPSPGRWSSSDPCASRLRPSNGRRCAGVLQQGDVCVTCHIMSLMTSIDIRQVILMLLRSCPGSPLHVLLPEVFLVSALLASSASGSGAGEGALAPRSRREAPGERDSELPGPSSRAVDGSVHVGTGRDERFWRENTSMSFHDDEIHEISTLYSWLDKHPDPNGCFSEARLGPHLIICDWSWPWETSQMYLMDHLGKVRIPLFEFVWANI